MIRDARAARTADAHPRRLDFTSSRRRARRIASLIATAKINEIEPFVYLKATLEAIAAGHPANRIDELLPWNFKPSS